MNNFSSDNIFVGLEVSQIDAENLALAGGIPASELHITLAQLSSDNDIATVATAVACAIDCCDCFVNNVLTVDIDGVARLNGEAGDDFFVALTGGEPLDEVQEEIEDCIEDFIPDAEVEDPDFMHITLTRLAVDENMPISRLDSSQINFTGVVVASGDMVYRLPFPTGPMVLDVNVSM